MALWAVWFGPMIKFFLRSILEVFLLAAVAAGLTTGAAQGYKHLHLWIGRRQQASLRKDDFRLFYDAVSLVYVLVFVVASGAVVGVAAIQLWSNGNYVTYAVVYAILTMSVVAAYDDWRIVPTIMIAAGGMLVGNIVVENLFNPSLVGLRSFVSTLPGYSA